MPSNVAWFEKFSYGSILVGLVGLYLMWQKEASSLSSEEAVIVLGAILFTLALNAMLIWLTARRRKNWARYLFAGLFVLGLPNFSKEFLVDLGTDPVEDLLSAAQLAMEVAALILIFTGNAREWFAKSADTRPRKPA